MLFRYHCQYLLLLTGLMDVAVWPEAEKQACSTYYAGMEAVRLLICPMA